MIIRSDFLTEGLFGQVFAWMLEVLPYIESMGWRPKWEILTRNYGGPPDFNVFPGIIECVYEPEGSNDLASLEKLQRKKKHNFRFDFAAAHRTWNAHFRFTADVLERLDEFWSQYFADRTVLGVHYRGTDKSVDLYQTNPVTQYQFLCVIEDFLNHHSDIDAIFVASDDARFVKAMNQFPNVHHFPQTRSTDNRPMWNNHAAMHNQTMAKDAILDCLTLARCRYGLKCMSQLSAFSKIMNPQLEIYRVSACKPGWFPEAYVPRYRSEQRAVNALLNVIQLGDFQSSGLKKASEMHRQALRYARQIWRKAAHSAQR